MTCDVQPSPHPQVRASPGGSSPHASKEKEGGSARADVRVQRSGGGGSEDGVSLARAEEAVKKIFLITGEHDAQVGWVMGDV